MNEYDSARMADLLGESHGLDPLIQPMTPTFFCSTRVRFEKRRRRFTTN